MATQAQIDRVMNEGGEGYSQSAVNADRAAEASYLAEVAAKRAAFAAEWTVEVLAARRATWNAEMQALSAAGKRMTPDLMISIVKRLGYGLTEIQQAKAMHGVK